MSKFFGLKYRLREKLNDLPHREYQVALRDLPHALGISERTFHRYLNVQINEKFSIPSDVLIKLTRFFECRVEDLINYDPPPFRVKGIRRQKNIEIRRKFRLVK